LVFLALTAPGARGEAAPRRPSGVRVLATFQGPEGNSGSTVLTLTFQRTNADQTAATGDYQTIDGTATVADNDYKPVSGTFTIPAFQTTSNPIPIEIIGDTKVENDESFTLAVSNVQGTQLIDPGPYTFTILNDDAPVIRVSDATAKEGDAGTTPLTFTVTLVTPAAIPVQVAYSTTPGTATAGQDYQSVDSTLTFAPGETQKTITVDVLGDTLFEANETLTLNATPSNGGARVTATGTITNDDRVPAATVRIVSGNGQGARLGQPLAQPLVIEVLNANGAPSVGDVVQWRVTKGAATLNPSTSTTNAQGRASITVTPTSVGTIEVQAVVGNLAAAIFTINATTSFADRATGPVAVPIARVLDQICARNENDGFAPVCNALSQVGDGQLTSVLEHVAPQQSGAQSKVASEVVSVVAAGVGSRLAALRSGAERFSVNRLSLTIDGRPVPVAALANALLPLTKGMTSAADEPEADFNGWSAFLSGDLGSGKRIARDGQLGFDLKTRGLMFGVDRLVRDTVVGVSANVMKLDSTLSDSAGSLDTKGYALTLYASRGDLFAGTAAPATAGSGMRYDGVHLDGSLTFGRNRYDAEHVVDIPLLPSSRARSSNDANVFALSGVTGIDAHSGKTDFDLTLGGTWSKAQIDDLTETGSGPLILFVEGHDVESLTATGGFNVRTAWPVPFGILQPSVRAELVHEFKSGARLVTARFLRDRLGTSFTIPLDQPDPTYGKLGAGLQAVFERGFSAHLEYTQDVSRSDLHFRTVQLNISKSF
jgi:outer membrane autotransporter protein